MFSFVDLYIDRYILTKFGRKILLDTGANYIITLIKVFGELDSEKYISVAKILICTGATSLEQQFFYFHLLQ